MRPSTGFPRCISRTRRQWPPPSRPTPARRPAAMRQPIAPTASAWSARRSRSSEMPSPISQDQLHAELAEAGYLADETLVTALYLALELGKPLLLEGVP